MREWGVGSGEWGVVKFPTRTPYSLLPTPYSPLPT